MHSLLVTLLFNERLIQALCLTLVHSLWQGLLLALVTGILILLTRRSAPLVRYGLFSAAFVLFLLGSVYTFILQWNHAANAAAAPALVRTEVQPSMEMGVGRVDFHGSLRPDRRDVAQSVVTFFNEHAYLIVLIWFLILSMKMVRVTVQLGSHRRLRRHRVHSPSVAWQDRVRELALGLGIRMPVSLLESEIVTVPMMMGFLKPVILLPVSLLAQLPPAETEAILLHELAHIRRGDYFVNIIFTFWEMIFFFNPAVLWICALIREERENCCDDIAVRHIGNKKEFISALVSFVRIEREAGGLAMSFPGSGNHLLQRVRRIAYRDDKRLDGKEKFFLVFCFVFAGLMTLAYTHASPQRKNSPHTMTALAIRDSVPDEQVDSVKITAKKEKMEEKVRIKAEKASGKEEQKEEIKEKKDAKEAGEKEELKERVEPKEKIEAKEAKEKEEMKEMKEKDELKEMKEPKEKDELKERDELQEITALLDKELMKERQEIRELKERTETPEIRERLEILDAKEVAEKKEVIRQLELSKMKIDQEVHEQKVQFDSLTRIHNDHHQKIDQSQRMLQSIIDGLVQERLIDDGEGAFSFSLDNEALIVNGVRQSEELHKRFVQQYLGGPHNRVEFSRSKNKGTHSSVTINTN